MADQVKKRGPKVSVAGASAHRPGTQEAEQAENNAKARKGALFIGAVLVVYLAYLIFTGQMATFIDALKNVDRRWIVAACLSYCIYFVFGTLAFIVAVWLDHDSPVGIRDCASVDASGIFFGNLTPMMAGAVPSQIFRLTRTGLDVGEAMATQFTRFIMYQVGLCVFGGLMLAARLDYFASKFGNLVLINIVVFGMHVIELTFLLVVSLCPNLVRRVGNWLIRFLSKRGWLKDRDRWNEMVNVQVQEFSDAFKRACTDLPSMGVTFVITMIELAGMYMIPWFVLKAFGITESFITCMAIGSTIQLVGTAVPLPGGTGGIEASFALFLGGILGSKATAGYLVWRLITFIGPTIFAAPLLGLRSTSTVSIYHRWERLVSGGGLKAMRGGVRAKLPRGGKRG